MSSDPTIGRMWPTPQLIRAARGLVNIDQGTLAAAAGVSRKAVISLEGDESETMDYRRLDVLQKLRRVLEEKWGIEFVRESRSSNTQTASTFSRKSLRKSAPVAAVSWPRPFACATRNIVNSCPARRASCAAAPRWTRIISALPNPARSGEK